MNLYMYVNIYSILEINFRLSCRFDWNIDWAKNAYPLQHIYIYIYREREREREREAPLYTYIHKYIYEFFENIHRHNE